MAQRDYVPSALPASQEQKEYLLSYMEKRPAFCQGEFTTPQGKEANLREWNNLMNALNNVPRGTNKSTTQWQKFWNDQKAGVKKRAARAAHYPRGTGGGPPPRPEELLTTYDQRVLSVMGGWKRVMGVQEIKDPLEINPFGRNRRSRSPTSQRRSNDRSHVERGRNMPESRQGRSYSRSPRSTERYDRRRTSRSGERRSRGRFCSEKRRSESRRRSYSRSARSTERYDRRRTSRSGERRSRSNSYAEKGRSESRRHSHSRSSRSTERRSSHSHSQSESRSRDRRTPEEWEHVPHYIATPVAVDDEGWEVPPTDIVSPVTPVSLPTPSATTTTPGQRNATLNVVWWRFNTQTKKNHGDHGRSHDSGMVTDKITMVNHSTPWT